MIPPITNELGRYWEQPDPAGILVDDTHAVMSAADFALLKHYDSLPSGVYDGKMWRARGLLCWYGPSDNPDHCSINTREIIVV